jgi:hypothetical protein
MPPPTDDDEPHGEYPALPAGDSNDQPNATDAFTLEAAPAPTQPPYNLPRSGSPIAAVALTPSAARRRQISSPGALAAAVGGAPVVGSVMSAPDPPARSVVLGPRRWRRMLAWEWSEILNHGANIAGIVGTLIALYLLIFPGK